jgi:DNA-binding MarR family transcriptional regulator
MADSEAAPPASATETEITLGLLNAVHDNSAVTQRSVARELGIALGLANAYLKRCVKKGLIKVSQVPPNRYAYYLTPQGFAEKSRLTAEYLSYSFTFFRRARSQCEELFADCAERGRRRVALAGASELAEIATLVAREFDIELVAVLDGESAGQAFHGVPVLPRDASLPPVDAVIVTDLAQAQRTFDALRQRLPGTPILAPKMLRVARKGAAEAAA